MMFSASAATAPRRSLFAFHFELSRTPRRKPSSFVLRGARGVMARSTMPHGSNRMSLRITGSRLELAPAVRASVAGYHRDPDNGSQDGCAHVSPSRDKCRKAARVATNDKQMNSVLRLHNWNPTVRLALVPFWKIAIVDLAITMTT